MKVITQYDMFGRKECSQCGRLLPIDRFVSDPRKKRGVTSNCKDCRSKATRRWAKANEERIRQQRRTPEALEYARATWQRHKVRTNAKRREQRDTEAYRAYMAEKQRHYRRTSPQHRVKMNLRSRVNLAIKGGYKSGRTVELLGCDVAQFLAHIERQWQSGMTWDNYGNAVGQWNIDHIRPCASFDLADPVQQRECFHYSNCRPMWTSDNCSKGAKPPEEFEKAVA